MRVETFPNLSERFVPPQGIRRDETSRTEPNVATLQAHEKAAIAAGHNSPVELNRRFFDPSTEGHLSTVFTECGMSRDEDPVIVRTSVIDNTAKYFWPSVLVAAGPLDLRPDRNGLVPSFFEYDLPEQAQTVYWLTFLESLRAADEHAFGKNGHGLAVVNSVSTLSTATISSSKSIALPHAHIFHMDPTTVDSGASWSIDHLAEEQQMKRESPTLQKAGEIITQRLLGVRSGLLSVNAVGLRLGEVGPFGYEFNIGAQGNEVVHPCDLQKVMREHHLIYSRVAKLLEKAPDSRVLVPQPSYRVYMKRHEDEVTGENLHVVISPEFISGSGPLEDMGIYLERKMGRPDAQTLEDQAVFNRRVLDRVGKSLETLAA
jgi:hypothetical protein